LSFIFEEAKCSKTTGFVKKNCGCVIKTSYEFPSACTLAMKIKKILILLDDIDPHWQMLHVCEEAVDVMKQWNGIRERLKKVSKAPYKMKLHIKEVMHQLAFSEDTMLSPPPGKVVTKRAMKRLRSTPKESSAGRI